MRKVLERSYSSHLKLEGAIEHFLDSLSGEFNSNIKEEKVNTMSRKNNFYDSEVILENGDKLDIEVSLWEYDNLDMDNQTYEWNCFAYKN